MVEEILNSGNGVEGPGGSAEQSILYRSCEEVWLASLLLENSQDISPRIERDRVI